ncbi:MAG: alpha/beta fold hydrolase, partial [Comamonadaceae bacterium]
ASPAELLAAWYKESVQDVRVFGWRQPFRWRRWPDRLTGEPGRSGIVFIHGFVCNRGFWAPWLERAQAQGHACIAVNLEPVYGAIDDYFDTIDSAVRRLTDATGRPPALVCHSMGGLAARAWLRRRGDRAAVAHVVTIGTPHRGTALARWSRAPNGRQMRVQGSWLRELADAEADAAGLYTCWWSNCDNIVMPPSTATLPGADNRLVPGLAHVDLAFHPAVLGGTMALLRDL